jgi:DNA-binding response OmpR family regulator
VSATVPTILVVDDEKNTARTMALALQAAGYQTVECNSGKEVLQLSLTDHPELLILDYHMSDEDGVSILKKLRKDEWGKSVPVIMASNVYDVDLMNSIMNLGVQDYVLKSDVNLDDIVKLVGKYVPLPTQPGQ